MRRVTPALMVLLAALVLPATLPAAPKVNTHNTHDCLFCHGETPKFGVDTRATVTFKAGGWDDPALCLRCHKPEENLHPLTVKPGAPAAPVAPRDLPLGTSAGIEGTVVCATCHFVHAADADHSLLRGFPGSQRPDQFKAWQDLCRECHGSSLDTRSPHTGDEKVCGFCHQATPKKGQPVTVVARGEAVCNFCHGGIQNGHFAKANPFGETANCSTCHDPHLGADHPGRLKGSYVDAARKEPTVDPHLRKTLCFACHKDDLGKEPVAVEDPVALCNRCHGTGRIPGDPHPMAKVPATMKIPAGWPVRDGALTCLTCHRAGHREDAGFYRFLRGGPYANRSEICYGCHDREAFKKMNPHQDINQNKGCEICHAVRPVPGKDTAKTTRILADTNVLCLRCHPEAPHPSNFQHTIALDEKRAKGIPAQLPLDAGGRITCATCHNPHIEETGEAKLRGGLSGMEICGLCHRM